MRFTCSASVPCITSGTATISISMSTGLAMRWTNGGTVFAKISFSACFKETCSLIKVLHIDGKKSKMRILEHRLTIVTVFSNVSILTASQTDPINVITNSIAHTIPSAEVSASITIVSRSAFCFEYKQLIIYLDIIKKNICHLMC